MGTLNDFRKAIGFPQEDNNVADRFILTGGLNIEQPDSAGSPGSLIVCNNYEPVPDGGYRSKGGFEPVDGQVQPSAFVYQAVTVNVTNAANLPAVGAKVQVAASKYVYFLGYETVGGVTYMVFTQCLSSLMTSFYTSPIAAADIDYRGAIPNPTTLTTFGVGAFGATTSAATFLADPTRSYAYIVQARAIIMARITPVGGATCTGKALGVFDWGGFLFGVRNKADNSQALLFVATPNSWLQIGLGSIVYYTANSVQLNIGDTLTGNSSGATATITGVVTMFGTVGGGDATGYVTCNSVTGTFTAGEVLKVGATNVAKAPASGTIQQANTLPPGGSYRFARWNFSGVANNVRLYGVNGVGTAFELKDMGRYGLGTLVFTPIITGYGLTAATFNAAPATDTPTCIAEHKDQLFLGYNGGNLQHSGYQLPTSWTAVQGADQRTLGDDITNIVPDVNGTCIVTTRHRIFALYGDVNENFQLRDLATTFGAYANSAARISGCTFLTDEGLMFYDQAEQFGNFESVSLSKSINALLKAMMRNGAGVLEANVSRDKSMYRLYFDGGKVLSFCIVGSQLAGIGMCDYGQNVHNFWSVASTIPVNDLTPTPPPPEKIYCCGDDGYVYQDDTGGTFGATGTPISGGCQTQFYYGQDDVDHLKYYRRVFLDILGADVYTNLQVGAEYDDGYGYRTPEVLETVTRYLTGAVFDQNSLYGVGFYGGAGKNVLRKELHNSGVAISLIFAWSSAVAFPHTIQAVQIARAIRARRNWR